MQTSPITYRNLGILIVSLVLTNIAIGLYKSFEKKKTNIHSVNYFVKNSKSLDNNSGGVKVDYISQSSEMIEIFSKYEFSIENLFRSDSANLIIFSSLPNDFMDIQPVVDRKKLFINTLIPIIYSENLRILSERKNIGLVARIKWREFLEGFWPQWLFELSEKYESNDSNLEIY